MITVNDLPEIINMLALGFAIGIGGGVAAYILVSLLNVFTDIAK